MDPITAVIVAVVAYSITDVYYAATNRPRPSHQRWLDREERRAARGEKPQSPPGPLKRMALAGIQDWSDRTEARLKRQQEKRRAREPARTKRQADRALRREQRKLARYYRRVRRFRAAREATKDAAGRLIDQLQDAVWRPYEEQQAWDANAEWDANAPGSTQDDGGEQDDASEELSSESDEEQHGARRRHLVAVRSPRDPDREYREQQHRAREERDRSERERARASQQAFQADQAQQQRDHEWKMFLLNLYAEHAASGTTKDGGPSSSSSGSEHGPGQHSEAHGETAGRTWVTAERLDQDQEPADPSAPQHAEFPLLNGGPAEIERTEEEHVAETDTDQTVQTAPATVSEITSLNGGIEFANAVNTWTTGLMNDVDAQRGDAVSIESDFRSMLSAVDGAVASLKGKGFADNSTQVQRYTEIRDVLERSLGDAQTLQSAANSLINSCDAVAGSTKKAHAALQAQLPLQEQALAAQASDGVGDLEFYLTQ